MKTIILAGGFGSRISEESQARPKPMIEVGGKPLLWHIMKIYSQHAFREFVICLGYKGYVIKDYFANYFLHESDVTFDFATNTRTDHSHEAEQWKVTLVNTGLESMTGSRIRRARPYIGESTFMMTYGDGVSNIDIQALVAFHRSHGKLATVTGVQPDGRFGSLAVDPNGLVSGFHEKPKSDGNWVNGGFFVLEPGIFQYLAEGDDCVFENEPLEQLARDNQLMVYKHFDFWQPVDTLREKNLLEAMWRTGDARWKTW